MLSLSLLLMLAACCSGMIQAEIETETNNLQETDVVTAEEGQGKNESLRVASNGVGTEAKTNLESKDFVVQGGIRFGSVEDVSRQEIGKLGVSLNGSNIEVKPSWSYGPIPPAANLTRSNRVAELQAVDAKKSEFVKSSFEPQMQRILEPIQTPSQSQRINLQLPLLNASGEFRPSPQLQLPIYEFNRFPVVPAHPEPKSFGGKADVWSKVRFPESPVTVKDFPYPFASQKNFPALPQSFDQFDDKTFIRKPDFVHEVVEEEKVNTDLASSPWKKVIKILAAFVPIGLLISALTPSVITISPMNGTYARGRANVQKPIALDLLSQVDQDGCDERIFCEILLSAEENKQSKMDAANLLKNYARRNKEGKSAKILKAVKSGKCDALRCDGMKNN